VHTNLLKNRESLRAIINDLRYESFSGYFHY
jgi:hypothetical protein